MFIVILVILFPPETGKATQISIDKQNVVYPHDGILSTIKRN